MRQLRLAIGLAIVALAAYLISAPLVVAGALGRPHETSAQLINLRASWGGTLAGLGAFVAWLPAWKPWGRAAIGLVAWAMAGIGIARLVGFVVDGNPDMRQWIWISAETFLAVGGWVLLRRPRDAT